METPSSPVEDDANSEDMYSSVKSKRRPQTEVVAKIETSQREIESKLAVKKEKSTRKNDVSQPTLQKDSSNLCENNEHTEKNVSNIKSRKQVDKKESEQQTIQKSKNSKMVKSSSSSVQKLQGIYATDQLVTQGSVNEEEQKLDIYSANSEKLMKASIRQTLENMNSAKKFSI